MNRLKNKKQKSKTVAIYLTITPVTTGEAEWMSMAHEKKLNELHVFTRVLMSPD